MVLDCQSDWLDHFGTRFVIPLVKDLPVQQIARLHPTVLVSGEPMILATHLAAAVPLAELGGKITDVADQHFLIMDALDVLISDF